MLMFIDPGQFLLVFGVDLAISFDIVLVLVVVFVFAVFIGSTSRLRLLRLETRLGRIQPRTLREGKKDSRTVVVCDELRWDY